MLVEHSGARNYLVSALEAAPELFEYSLRDLSDNEADFRPDAARFSLREVMAHLADWDVIFLERLQRTREEDEPFLPDINEGQLVFDHEYSKSNPRQQLHLFRERRALIVSFLRALAPGDWQRTCQHERVGRLTLEGLALLIPLHDTYHIRQVVQWRENYA